jgi:hypothetical protein
VGLKQAGGDILFGRPPASPAPIAALPPVPTFPAPVELPPLPPLPTALPTPSLCPSASPLAFPKLEASITPPGPPLPGTYPFHYKGTDSVDAGPLGKASKPIAGFGFRQVTNVSPVQLDGHYTFDVVETFAGMSQTNSYEVYRKSRAAAILPGGVSPDAGIYLTQQKFSNPSATFTPATPIELMSFPAQDGPETLDGTGSDGMTTMEIDPNSANANSSLNAGRVTVDACGTVLQGWKDLLAGRIVSAVPGAVPEKDFALELDFGTQFGGISLRDHLVETFSPAAGIKETYDITATISVSPKAPAP